MRFTLTNYNESIKCCRSHQNIIRSEKYNYCV
jgi:hypothetical protein